jgi:hypothetical protein
MTCTEYTLQYSNFGFVAKQISANARRPQ